MCSNIEAFYKYSDSDLENLLLLAYVIAPQKCIKIEQILQNREQDLQTAHPKSILLGSLLNLIYKPDLPSPDSIICSFLRPFYSNLKKEILVNISTLNGIFIKSKKDDKRQIGALIWQMIQTFPLSKTKYDTDTLSDAEVLQFKVCEIKKDILQLNKVDFDKVTRSSLGFVMKQTNIKIKKQQLGFNMQP